MSKDWTEQTAIQLLEEENAQLRTFNKELLYDNEQKTAEIQRLLRVEDKLKRGSVVEIAAENNRLTEYMFHWEGRALEAEAKDTEIERLRMALDLIVNHPVTDTGMWEVGAKEMRRLANAALSGEYQMPPMEDDDVKA